MEAMDDRSDILMLRGVAALCPDCAGERVFVPVDGDAYCCTSCAAGVLLLLEADRTEPRPSRQVA